MNLKLLLPLAASLALAACATAPKPLQGQFSAVTPRDSVSTQQVGTPVRWGGRIIETLPSQGQTCFQLISRPLNASGRPTTASSDRLL